MGNEVQTRAPAGYLFTYDRIGLKWTLAKFEAIPQGTLVKANLARPSTRFVCVYHDEPVVSEHVGRGPVARLAFERECRNWAEILSR